MTAVAFDTLKLARALRDRGKLTPEQAEGVADSLSEAFRDEMATKADIGEVKADIARVEHKLDTSIADARKDAKADIAALRAELKADIARIEHKLDTSIAEVKADIARVEHKLETSIADLRSDVRLLEHRMTIKLGGMMVVAIGVVAALVKLL